MMTTRRRILAGAASVGALLWGGVTYAGPNRYTSSDRVDRHMLPAVSTGPLDPAWSPDGKWIAFSMRGDIWKVPAGRTAIEAVKGFEYRPRSLTVDVPAGGVRATTVRLERLVDLPARGWYSGDTHIHDLHQGRFGLTHETFFDQLRAEDLRHRGDLVGRGGLRRDVPSPAELWLPHRGHRRHRQLLRRVA